MILLLLGTNPYPFNRLLNAVTNWAEQTGETVIAQVGHTPVGDKILTMECHDFVSHDQVLQWIKQAEFIICQGGFGSLKDCIANNKPVMAVPRYQELNECQDSQKELVLALEEEGCIVPLYDIEKFEQAINEVRHHQVKIREQSAIPKLVSKIINDFMSV